MIRSKLCRIRGREAILVFVVPPACLETDHSGPGRSYGSLSGIRLQPRLHVTFGRIGTVSDSGKSRSSREKVRRHRERLRQQGFRPIQIWVPDVRAPSFRVQAHRQSLAVAESAMAYEDQAFIDAISELDSV